MTHVGFDLGFDASATTAIESFGKVDPIPKGKYRAKATAAEQRQTKQCEDCWYWLLEFTIDDGEYVGHTVLYRFNIVNTNKQAEKMGKGQLARYLHCIGNMSPNSAADLCNVPVLITVGTRKNVFTNDEGEQVEAVVNEITRVDPYTPETQSE